MQPAAPDLLPICQPSFARARMRTRRAAAFAAFRPRSRVDRRHGFSPGQPYPRVRARVEVPTLTTSGIWIPASRTGLPGNVRA